MLVSYHQPKSYKYWLKQTRAVVVTSKELMQTGEITLLADAAAGAASLDVSHSDVGLTSKNTFSSLKISSDCCSDKSVRSREELFSLSFADLNSSKSGLLR